MGISQRFLNFAASMTIVAVLLLLSSCKGKTVDNMVPFGDTIEVVISQPIEPDTLNTN